MKLAIDETFESSGLGETTEFKLKASPMAFKILSDGLYRDKIGAVVRELACNAYDAHVAAGTTDTPFYVHAPSYLEPFFEIRDYGIGLSEADVLNLYTTYFESTKSNSNEFIGALGLGSKSPFSYSNNFNVTSFFEGVQYDFCVFLDSRGMPTISKLNDQPTEEANGLKITIQMNKIFGDAELFRTAMKRYLSVFKNLDTSGIVIAELEYVADFNTCRVIVDSNRWNIPMFQVKQGHVLYPLDLDMLKINSNSIGFTLPSYHSFLLEAPIGSCAITASREELGYDDDTITYLKQQVNDIIAELSTSAQIAYDESLAMYPDDIFELTHEFAIRVRDNFKCVNIENLKIECGDVEPQKIKNILSKKIDQHAIMYNHLKYRKTNYKRTTTWNVPCDNTNSLYIIYPHDKPSLPSSCVQEFYDRADVNQDKKLYFIKDVDVEPVVQKYAMTVADFKLQYTPPRKLSSRTKTIKDAITKQADMLYLKVLNSSDFIEVSASDIAGCYYLPHNYIKKDKQYELLNCVKELKVHNILESKPVYILNKENIALYAKTMINLEAGIISNINKIASIQLRGSIKEIRFESRLSSNHSKLYSVLADLNVIKKFPKLLPFGADVMSFSYVSISKLQQFFSFKHKIDFNATINTHKTIFKNELDIIQNRFPMLGIITQTCMSQNDKKIVIDYINDILSKELLELDKAINKEDEDYVKVS